jgi:ribonuclease P protein component
VVHLAVDRDERAERGDAVDLVPRAGFIVSKAVGGAVVRNTVARRLRALVGQRLVSLPPGSALVVRALPAAAHASSAELASDLDACLAGVLPGVRA